MGKYIFKPLALVFIAVVLSSCSGRSDIGRTGTLKARLYSHYPLFCYFGGCGKSLRDREKVFANRIKTWDNTQQIIPWEELAASIQRHEIPAGYSGCVYKDLKLCPGCHTQQARIYYRQKANSICRPMEGWVVLCVECRKQVKFETIKK